MKMGIDAKLGLLVCLSLLLNGVFLVQMLLNHSELLSGNSSHLSRHSHDASGEHYYTTYMYCRYRLAYRDCN